MGACPGQDWTKSDPSSHSDWRGPSVKAYRLHAFGGPESLKCEDLPAPEPGYGQVRVRLRATSLNFRDLMMSKGVYNPKLKLPLIPLSDGAGEVAAVGEG